MRRRSVNVLDGEEDQAGVCTNPLNPPGVEQHDLPPDGLEGVRDLEIVERCLLRQNLSEQLPQGRDVPLPVAQVVEQSPLGFYRLDPKGAVERAVGPLDPERAVEDQ